MQEEKIVCDICEKIIGDDEGREGYSMSSAFTGERLDLDFCFDCCQKPIRDKILKLGAEAVNKINNLVEKEKNGK